MSIFFAFLGAFIGAAYGILNAKLASSAKRIHVLEGILPICGVCKRIRNENAGGAGAADWISVEAYISSKTDANFSHTYCPKCYEQFKEKIE